MIDLLIDNNIKSEVLTVKDSSVGLTGIGITEGKIIVKGLGFEKTINGVSTPTIANFLNPSLSVSINIPAKIDDIVDVEYYLLKPLSTPIITNGLNAIERFGIYNEAKGFNRIYTNGVAYVIDWDSSTANRLYVTEPFVNPGPNYSIALYKVECAPVLYNVPKLIKTLALSQTDCACKNCGKAADTLTKAYRLHQALMLSTDQDCEVRKTFMRCLKELFNLC